MKQTEEILKQLKDAVAYAIASGSLAPEPNCSTPQYMINLEEEIPVTVELLGDDLVTVEETIPALVDALCICDEDETAGDYTVFYTDADDPDGYGERPLGAFSEEDQIKIAEAFLALIQTL